MRVLIAPDKFKGSLTAAEVADHLAKGLAEAGAHSRTLPLADGGDGSVAAALAAGFGSLPVDVHGATGQSHRSMVAFDADTTIVEVANTCGLATLPGGVLRPHGGIELRIRRSHPGGTDPGPQAHGPRPRRQRQHRRRNRHARRARIPLPRPSRRSACPHRRQPGPHPLRRPQPRRRSRGHRAHRRRRRHQPPTRIDRRRCRFRSPEGGQ